MAKNVLIVILIALIVYFGWDRISPIVRTVSPTAAPPVVIQPQPIIINLPQPTPVILDPAPAVIDPVVVPTWTPFFVAPPAEVVPTEAPADHVRTGITPEGTTGHHDPGRSDRNTRTP